MWKIRLGAIVILIIGAFLGSFVYNSEATEESKFQFKFGLDLSGGTHLIYRADTSEVTEGEVNDAMNTLRDVIERRVNLFGVSEPIVQVEKGGQFAGVSEERLIVELPGITDVGEAVRLIGETPLLDFRLYAGEEVIDTETGTTSEAVFVPTGLTGRFLKQARLEFGTGGQDGFTNEPYVVISFNKEGADLFEKITTENTGELLGIFLDGVAVSVPVIQEPIPGGEATISGSFQAEEARELVRNLNFGALPVPIELLSTQTIGAALGAGALSKGLVAGMVGLVLVALFMALWYRLPGLVAVVSLSIYIALMLSIFKFIPVTLTAAGIAGFILSIGMAVDANILIFERMKEELESGKNTEDSARDGFRRAWLAIRDGNLSSMITAVVLFWFGTSLIEGFALTFGIGVLVSMITAITVTRTLLYAIGRRPYAGTTRFLYGSGFRF